MSVQSLTAAAAGKAGMCWRQRWGLAAARAARLWGTPWAVGSQTPHSCGKQLGSQTPHSCGKQVDIAQWQRWKEGSPKVGEEEQGNPDVRWAVGRWPWSLVLIGAF